MCVFNCIIKYSLYHYMDIGNTWHCALVDCTPSQSIGLVFVPALFCCWVSLCIPFTRSLIEFYFIMIVVTIIDIFIAIIVILNYTLRLSVTKYFWLCKCAPPGMFPPVDIPFEHWIEHVTFGLLYVMFRISSRTFYRGVPGFATDCSCGVWCRWLIICLLYVGPRFGNQVCNNSGFINLT